jgi:hypothetical protein
VTENVVFAVRLEVEVVAGSVGTARHGDWLELAATMGQRPSQKRVGVEDTKRDVMTKNVEEREKEVGEASE